MKLVIIIPDGCADYPLESFGGKTPLQASRVPAMDSIAAMGLVGRTDNVPLHFPAGSEVANMTLFGYDPNQYFTGRAPSKRRLKAFRWGPRIGPCVAIWSRYRTRSWSTSRRTMFQPKKPASS